MHTSRTYIVLRTQIYPTEEQKRRLEQMAAATGKRQSDLIRLALDQYLAEQRPQNWFDALEPLFGMWVRPSRKGRSCTQAARGGRCKVG